MGGIASVIVGYPLDTIKVRMQQAQPCTTGVLSGLRKETLFRGVWAPALAITPQTAVMYWSYGWTCRTLSPETAHSSRAEQPFWVTMYASIVSGAAYALVASPVELVKCNMQVTHAGSMWDCAKALYRQVLGPGLSSILCFLCLQSRPLSCVSVPATLSVGHWLWVWALLPVPI